MQINAENIEVLRWPIDELYRTNTERLEHAVAELTSLKKQTQETIDVLESQISWMKSNLEMCMEAYKAIEEREKQLG